jgi:hypothetical protein
MRNKRIPRLTLYAWIHLVAVGLLTADPIPGYKFTKTTTYAAGCPSASHGPEACLSSNCQRIVFSRPTWICLPNPGTECDPTLWPYEPGQGPGYKIYNLSCVFILGWYGFPDSCVCPMPGEFEEPVEEGFLASECSAVV